MSRPYTPLPPAPAGWSLNDAFDATTDDEGHHYVGNLRFVDQRMFEHYVDDQRAIGGTPEQLAMLHKVITTNETPYQEPVTPAPRGTTVDQLLDVSGKTPDAEGYYHLGSLRVHAYEHETFSKLQRGLSERNPEALDLLYHMEHTPEQPLTFRASTAVPESAYVHEERTLYWNPNLATRDAENGARVSPDTTALHEEAHWAIGDAGDVLAAIPSGFYGDREEQRAVEGTENRDMAILDRKPRESHFGEKFPVNRIDTINATLELEQQGAKGYAAAPWNRHGRVIEVADDMTTLAVRGNGTNPNDQLKINTEHLSHGMHDLDNAVALLEDARAHNDTIHIGITKDARVLYENPAQQERLHDNPHPTMRYPQPLFNQAALAPRSPSPGR
ncbi:MAG TPA: hypothetical protein VMA36_09915 [Candidatus Limnocylindria bacterium]|nr:hypothetical protein [Candidatus Limnocylindria bacterium]